MNRIIKRLGGGAIALAAVPVLLTATAPTASAHYNYGYQGKDFISIDETHIRGSVCDRERDGHAVYGIFTQGSHQAVVFWDGGDSGCDTKTFRYGVGFMKLCENTHAGTANDACTGWIRV